MYNQETVITSYLLNVTNLATMTDYYHHHLGLDILEKASKQVILGLAGRPLLILKEQVGQTRQQVAGLYHTAFLVPDQASLGGILRHLLVTNTPLLGGADHGYSQALYLQDPEDNGIEIYWDKPLSDWDVRANGQIIGVTEELDGTRLLELADNRTGLPSNTKLGHIHLQVTDLKANRTFYRHNLGFELKSNMKQADFLAYGFYHHHLAANTWTRAKLTIRSRNQLGLGTYALTVPNLDLVREQLDVNNYPYRNLATKLALTDPNGIELIIS